MSPAGEGRARVAPQRALAALRRSACAQAQWLGLLQGCIAWHLAVQCWRLLADGYILCRGRDWRRLVRCTSTLKVNDPQRLPSLTALIQLSSCLNYAACVAGKLRDLPRLLFRMEQPF